MNRYTLQYGTKTLEYSLSFAARKTLDITVHPNCAITVTAPVGSALASIEDKLKRRASWIMKQQREFEKYLPTLPARQYVSGETHLYLGKQYRLKVVEAATPSVTLTHGRFVIETPNPSNPDVVKTLLTAWYREKAQQIFAEQLEQCLKRVAVISIDEKPEMLIRSMPKRWGSCTHKGIIILNPRLIQVRKDLIDYVITHELCHLKEHNHSGNYYKLLDRVMPDWEERRVTLNECKTV